MTDFARLIEILARQRVDFIIVGGFAGTLHGSSVPTRDLDVVYSRDPENVERLAAALAPISPYLRGEIAGGGDYRRLLPHAVSTTVFGVECRFLGLEKLIEVKRAAGRPRDLLAVADLEALLEERDRSA